MRSTHIVLRDWKEEFAALIGEAKSDLVVSTPYVSREGVDFVLRCMTTEARSRVRLKFLTNISPQNICQGATDPEALRILAEHVTTTTVVHLPRLHAKVYVADRSRAIITSGNLTGGGLYRNHEYSVATSDPRAVRKVRHDLEELQAIGTCVSLSQLAAYCRTAERIKLAFQRQLSSVRGQVKRAFEKELRTAEDELIRVRLEGASPTKVFEDTILYLLRAHGALSTPELNAMVQAIHPELCDDAIDRVIDGQHFGKRWKHRVRSAQSHLKARGSAVLADKRWQLTSLK